MIYIFLIIPLVIGFWCAFDARKRGYSRGMAIVWFFSTWLALIIALPVYLILRRKIWEE
jgi:FtsH-binding integral membrane protein